MLKRHFFFVRSDLPEYDVVAKGNPDVREPEEGLVVTEKEVQGRNVLHGTALFQKGPDVLQDDNCIFPLLLHSSVQLKLKSSLL